MLISCDVILEARLASNMNLLNSVSLKSALQCAAHICLVGHQCGHKIKKTIRLKKSPTYCLENSLPGLVHIGMVCSYFLYSIA